MRHQGPNATHGATHADQTATKRPKLAIYPLKLTDALSVFADCAARQIGAGEHGDLCQMMSALALVSSALTPGPDVPGAAG